MKYEPLKNRKEQLKKDLLKDKKNEENNFHNGFKKGVDDSFSLFESYINLYKKYKNDIKLLMNEQKNIWSKWVKYYEKQSKVNSSDYLNIYNEWLFNYVFSDINNDSEGFLQI